MIDLKKLREKAEAANTAEMWYTKSDLVSCSYDYDKAFIEQVSPSTVVELLDMLEAAQEDSKRIDWICERTSINSKGTYSYGMEQDFDAKFVVMPSWYQRGKKFENLREAIDAAMRS